MYIIILKAVWAGNPVMACSWFSKGKAKEKEVKEKQGSGHQFAAGPVLGTSVCEVCDKPVSGKETLHCTSE